jgi:hypothetical protein
MGRLPETLHQEKLILGNAKQRFSGKNKRMGN